MALITLTKQLIAGDTPETTLRLDAQTHDPLVLPSEIFVHTTTPCAPYKRYCNVATFPQIDEIGVKATEEIPFFRLKSAVIPCRTEEEAESAWAYVRQRVERLVHQAQGDPSVEETFDI